MIYLTVHDVIEIHDSECNPCLIAEKRSDLESAVMAVQQSAFGEDAYPTIREKAAALLRGVAAAHAFVKGNKRCATLSVIVFSNLNGYQFQADRGELFHLVLDVIEDHLPVEKIAGVLADWLVEIPDAS